MEQFLRKLQASLTLPSANCLYNSESRQTHAWQPDAVEQCHGVPGRSSTFRPPVQGGLPTDSQSSAAKLESVRERPASPAAVANAPWYGKGEPEMSVGPIEGGLRVEGVLNMVARCLPGGEVAGLSGKIVRQVVSLDGEEKVRLTCARASYTWEA